MKLQNNPQAYYQDRTYGLDLYDFEARQFDAITPWFTSIDPLAEKFTWLTPYNYCAGDPVNCVDPDGEMTIFINGFDAKENELGTRAYWQNKDHKDVPILVKMKNIDVGGSVHFLDGSMGSRYLHKWDSMLNVDDRYTSGYLCGRNNAYNIFNSLKRNESGDFIEPLYVVAHSLGAAFAKGFLQSLMDIINEQGITGLRVFEIDLAPHQPAEQEAVEGVITLAIEHIGDNIVGGLAGSLFNSQQSPIKGAVNHYYNNSDKKQGHSVTDFNDSLKFLEIFLNQLENENK